MDIGQAEELKRKYEAFQVRQSKIEAVRDMKVKEATTIVRKYNFEDLKDWKKVVELRDAKKPEAESFLDEVASYMATAEPQLREIEDTL